MKGLAILLVDDEPLIRQAFSGGLRLAGFAVTTAADGIAALEHVEDGADKLPLYKDSVHPGDEGQALLGEALLGPTLAALASANQVKPPPQRCERMR